MVNRLLDIINEIKSDKGEESITVISAETSLRTDIGFDSFDLALLTAKIEDEFDVDVFENGVIDKVGDILTLLEK